MPKINERLKKLRENSRLTQKELSERLKMSRTAISMYESGERSPNYETLEAIADFFNCDMAYLLGEQDVRLKHTVNAVPVYGSVAAGIPIEAITDIDDWEELPAEMAAAGHYAALRIHGDSMEPKMSEGDVVIVRLQEAVENGDTAIVMVNGDEATCKRIKKTPEGILLISTNPKYEPMFYSNSQISSLPVRIWGKVVELRAKF